MTIDSSIDSRIWKSTPLLLAGSGDSAIIEVARAQEGKVNVKAQIVTLKTERAFKNAIWWWTQVTDVDFLSSLPAFHMVRL